ncbi:hypothetical protein ACXR0O_19260 [Verrucomicrobiota bacterium sgz303538]
MPNHTPIPQRPTSDGQLVFCINGILTRPSDPHAWTDRAVAWFLKHTDHDANAYEYFQTAILGRLFCERRHLDAAIELLARHMSGAPRPLQLHLVGHSRGCEIARRLVVQYGVPVESLHLFAAAVDPDFERNGLNQALRSNRVNRVRLYTSTEDDVLRWIAAASLGLYGRLGYIGPRNVDPQVAHRVEIVERNTYDHGDYFNGSNFEDSMRLVEWEVDNLPMR